MFTRPPASTNQRSLAIGSPASRAAIQSATSAGTDGPSVADDTRSAEELQTEVDRLKRLVAELMLDKQMLQDVAKKKW